MESGNKSFGANTTVHLYYYCSGALSYSACLQILIVKTLFLKKKKASKKHFLNTIFTDSGLHPATDLLYCTLYSTRGDRNSLHTSCTASTASSKCIDIFLPLYPRGLSIIAFPFSLSQPGDRLLLIN